jgi:hypothetical protein
VKYVCLICIDEKKLEALSSAEMRQLVKDSADYDAALAKRGGYYTAAALKPVETATTVRFRNGRPSVTDGPFAETKEQIGGFILIDAQNLDEAIEIAAKVPTLRLGCVEIRATNDLWNPQPKETQR